MSDLSQLSPAPWSVRSEEFDDWGLVRAGDGAPVLTTSCAYRIPDEYRTMPYGPERIAGPPEVAANAAFVALARNAFDVMMRRGWYAVPFNRAKAGVWWVVRTRGGYDIPLSFAVKNKHRGEFADPFTALVVADEWMKQQEATS